MRFLPLLLLPLILAVSPVQSFAAADSKAVVEDHAVTVTPDGEEAAAPESLAPHSGTEDAAVAAGSAEHAESGGLPQLNIGTYPSQVFWLLVMFTVLYLAFSKSILPSIGSVVEGRDNIVKGNLAQAESLKNQALAIQEAYEKNLDAARAKAVQAVQDVETDAKKKAADQMDAFKQRADSEMESAEVRVLAAKDRAMGDLAHVAAEVASVAAEKITGVNTGVQNARAIVDSIASKAKAA